MHSTNTHRAAGTCGPGKSAGGGGGRMLGGGEGRSHKDLQGREFQGRERQCKGLEGLELSLPGEQPGGKLIETTSSLAS